RRESWSRISKSWRSTRARVKAGRSRAAKGRIVTRSADRATLVLSPLARRGREIAACGGDKLRHGPGRGLRLVPADLVEHTPMQGQIVDEAVERRILAGLMRPKRGLEDLADGEGQRRHEVVVRGQEDADMEAR